MSRLFTIHSSRTVGQADTQTIAFGFARAVSMHVEEAVIVEDNSTNQVVAVCYKGDLFVKLFVKDQEASDE